MYITKLAFEKIKEFEGCKLQAYQDAAGVWTIGYGHTYNVRQGDKISQQYADMLLQEDIEHVERHLIALHDPEILNIVEEWMHWVYAGGKQLPGLVKRREWEAERFFDVSCEWDKSYE